MKPPLPDLVRKSTDRRCHADGKLRKEGCTVKLDNAPAPRLAIDLDKPGAPLGSHEKRCDYLLFATDGQSKDLIVALELKNGPLDAKKVINQLQAGACAAKALVPKGCAIRFWPVAVFRGSRKHERDKLRNPKNKIEFLGRRETVRSLTCGGSLMDVLRVKSHDSTS